MPAPSYFDLHFHPVFKQFISQFEEEPTERSYEDLCSEFLLTNYLLRFVDRDFLHILGSQTALRQMSKGGLTMGAASICALEYGIANSNGLLSEILRSGLTRPLDQAFFQKVRNGEVSYYRLFLYELALYKQLVEKTRKSEQPVQFLTRRAAQQGIPQKGYRLLLGIEGGHNLCRDKIGKPGKKDGAIRFNTELGLSGLEADSATDVLKNDVELSAAADSLKRFAESLWKDQLDVLYLTLTHLTHISQQLLATHAYGMKMLRHVAFYPQGCGLTPAGKEVVHTAYTLQDDYGSGPFPSPVLIDIKHMSLQSRLDFYDYREELAAKNITLPPILASHMGVTGYGIAEWKAAKLNAATYQKSEDDGVVQVTQLLTERRVAGYWGSVANNEFTFNPWSINLMDEDIVKVLESKGLIGLSLDVRILGFQPKIKLGKKDQPEYLSVPEYRKLFGLTADGDSPLEEDIDEDKESWLLPTKHERQPLCLCFHIVHILAVAAQYEIKDADLRICIGSDFDGLIDPLINCRNASELPELERALVRWLPVAGKAYAEEQALPNPIGAGAVKPLVRKILYENGEAFVQRWLQSSLSLKKPSANAKAKEKKVNSKK